MNSLPNKVRVSIRSVGLCFPKLNWPSLALLITLLVFSTSCGRPKEVGQTDSDSDSVAEIAIDSSVNDGSNVKDGASPTKTNDENSQFEFQELDDIESAFTKETVLKLNAIVARSLAAINAFDKARKMRTDDAQGTAELLEKCSQLSENASKAKADMDSAAKVLRESGETYNEAIFSAMVEFVDKVDKELHDEVETLRK